MKLSLSDVTLCVADCVTPELALRAIEKSQELCDFHSAILFTGEPPQKTVSCQIAKIPKLTSIDAYSYFLLKQLSPYIKTAHVLVIQWDGYVLEPSAWTQDFLQYDYIGAKWDWHHDGMHVGNGGFSLRSKKLLNATHADTFPYTPGVPEDEQICRLHRPYLMAEHGISFAPAEVADRFSYERSRPVGATFGFHGLFNMWRHSSDEEMMQLIDHLTPKHYRAREFVELMFQYFALRKFKPLAAMYRKIKSVQTTSEFRQHALRLSHNEQLSFEFVNVCEELVTE